MLQSSYPCDQVQDLCNVKGVIVRNVNGVSYPPLQTSLKTSFFRFVLPLKGPFEYDISGIGYTSLLPGTFDFIFLPDETHFGFLKQDSSIVIDCLISNEILKSIGGHTFNALLDSMAKLKPFHLFKPAFVSSKVLQIASDLINSAFVDDLRVVYGEVKTIELILYLLQIIGNQANPFLISLKSYDLERLFFIRDFLTYHSLQALTLSMIAREAGLNEFKLKKGFKELFGITVFGYVLQIRMNHALKLLNENHKSIKEIAYQSGYRNPAHFTTAFKKFHGLTPREAKKLRLNLIFSVLFPLLPQLAPAIFY
jgi:AraC-like DNA-binding protein